jgi:alkylated DNA nucleotide flippase Atl1
MSVTVATMTRFSPAHPERSKFQGLPVYARLVLDVVDHIPPGLVMAYGDIAEWLEQGTPRLVARVMSTHGGDEVPWWRVLRADGTLAPEVADRQAPLLEAEHVAWKVPGHRVDMVAARWDPSIG